MGVVAVFGAVDARENETTDQGTRATKNDARAEPARTWNERTPVTRERGSAGPLLPANWKLKNEHDVAVALCGFLWLF